MFFAFIAPGLIPLALASTIPQRDNPSYLKTCRFIKGVLSTSSAVFYPGSVAYTNDTAHFVPSSKQRSACSIEPGSPGDVSNILRILGQTDTPFAIKSGGHSLNQGFSSTTGVHISMSRFNSTVYDPKSKTVKVGTGQTWDRVYAELEPHGVNVLGGRIYGVGVGGYLLGGGYSWLSNRYGLGIDSIVAYELVLPSGRIVNVDARSYPDLFFGLKGGFNNFGIVTTFTLKAYPQGKVWGGQVTYSAENIGRFSKALADYSANNADKNAQIIAEYLSNNGTQTIGLNIFYNAPQVENGTFDEFLSIPTTSRDLKTRTFYEFVVSVSGDLLNQGTIRGGQATVALPGLSLPVINQLANQTQFWGSSDRLPRGSILTTSVEPFIPSSIVRKDRTLTAYPHDRFMSPPGLVWFWPGAENDAAGQAALSSACDAIRATALAHHENLGSIVQYPNYALPNAPLTDLYGENLPRLRALALKYDPKKVMHMAGGFKF